MSHSMKPLMLVLLMLFPIVLFAQQGNPSFIKEISAAADAAPAVSTALDDAALAPKDSSAASPYHPDANAQQQSPAQAPPPSPPPGVESRPKIPGSMVGYIDNPIVQNQIRIRFDAGFDDEFPDRSEFFYAKCGCYRHLNQSALPLPLQAAYDPNAPGPGLGVPNAINFQQLYMNVEFSPQRRFSAFVEVPIRWLQPQGFQAAPPASLGFLPFSSHAGLSDVTAGFKFAAGAVLEEHTLHSSSRAIFPPATHRRAWGQTIGAWSLPCSCTTVSRRDGLSKARSGIGIPSVGLQEFRFLHLRFRKGSQETFFSTDLVPATSCIKEITSG